MTGGSQGAQAINSAVVRVLPTRSRRAGVQVLHIIGPDEHGRRRRRRAAVPGGSLRRGHAVRVCGCRLRDLPIRCHDLCRAHGRRAARGIRALAAPARRAALQRRADRPGGGRIMIDNEHLSADWIVSEVLAAAHEPTALGEMSRAAAASGARDARRRPRPPRSRHRRRPLGRQERPAPHEPGIEPDPRRRRRAGRTTGQRPGRRSCAAPRPTWCRGSPTSAACTSWASPGPG